MVTKFLVTVSAIALAVGLSSASAEEVRGNNPGVRCASVANTAAATGSVSADGIAACKQAVVWSRFASDEAAPALVNSGVLHLVRSEYQDAITDFDAAIQAGAEPSGALNDRGIAESALHQYVAAVADYTKALAQNPDHAEQIYFNRAVAYEEQGNMKLAYLDYRAASETNPKWAKAAKELARFTVAHPSMS